MFDLLIEHRFHKLPRRMLSYCEAAMTFAIYPVDALPAGFRYSEGFLSVAAIYAFDRFYPWWFVDASSAAGVSLARHIKERNLVPFAKTDLHDDIACFNAADGSIDPAVVMICSTPDRQYGFSNFEGWLRQAVSDSTAFSPDGVQA